MSLSDKKCIGNKFTRKDVKKSIDNIKDIILDKFPKAYSMIQKINREVGKDLE